jgi:hypothetical protein
MHTLTFNGSYQLMGDMTSEKEAKDWMSGCLARSEEFSGYAVHSATVGPFGIRGVFFQVDRPLSDFPRNSDNETLKEIVTDIVNSAVGDSDVVIYWVGLKETDQ